MSEVPLDGTVSQDKPPLSSTGVPRSQETALPWDPAVGRCLEGVLVVLGGGAVSCERGAAVVGRVDTGYPTWNCISRLDGIQGYLAYENAQPPKTPLGP